MFLDNQVQSDQSDQGCSHHQESIQCNATFYPLISVLTWRDKLIGYRVEHAIDQPSHPVQKPEMG